MFGAPPPPPPVHAVVDYQLGGAYAPAADVQVVTRDVTATAAKGRYNVCYVNAFQSQPEDSSFWLKKHGDLVLMRQGKPVGDPDWPGEYLLDTSTAAKRTALLAILGKQEDTCARKGFQAVEPDNLDSWTRSHGLLTKADATAYARLLIQRAHRDHLAIAQKNTADLDGRKLGFDFAVAEECQVYGECGSYTRSYGDHVIEIEYTARAFAAACRARGGRISVTLRDRDVSPPGDPARVDKHC